MEIGSWLREAIAGKSAPRQATPGQEVPDQPKLTLGVTFHFHECLEVAGTTTFAKDAVVALADRMGLAERGYYEGPAPAAAGHGKPR